MPTWVGEWLPLIAVASLAGIINLIDAFTKFNRKFRSPFFASWKSLGLWWWMLIQLSLPICFVWFLFGPLFKPPISSDFIFKAITVGLSFTAFVNANIDLGFIPIPLNNLYGLLTQLAFQRIADNQVGRLADFKTDLGEELIKNTSQLELGLKHLKGYFEEDPSLSKEEKQKLLERIEAALTQTTIEGKINATVSIVLDIRSKDCPSILLKRFGCRETVQTYFPKAASRFNLPKP